MLTERPYDVFPIRQTTWSARYVNKCLTISMLTLLGCAGLSACSRSQEGVLTIKGSDTMVDLVSLWNEAYAKAKPDVQIALSGGGSGTGIAALINSTTDLCMSSRDLKDEEREQAKAQGKELIEHAVAMDGLAIIANPANPIASLTIEQLGKIYTGAYTNWSQLGGPDQPIQVLSRAPSSGTYLFFQEHVMDGKDYAEHARLLPATSGIVQSVTTDSGAIGYVGLGYAESAGDGIKVLPILKEEGSPPVLPTVETVHSGEYPIARKLFFITAGAPTQAQQDFLAFCTGADGRTIVEKSGYVTLPQ